MIHRPVPCAAVAAFLLIPAAAQTAITVPPSAAAADGLTESFAPFSYGGGRFQQVWAGTTLAPVSAVVSGVAYRTDTGPLSKVFGARSPILVPLTVKATAVTTRPSAIGRDYQANLGGRTPTTVFLGSLNLPLTPAASPAPWAISIPFKTPVTVPVDLGEHLLIDGLVSSPVRTAYLLDAESTVRLPGLALPYGTAGVTDLTAQTEPRSGGLLALQMCGANGTLLIGRSRYDWAGLPLPLDLSPLGAPGERLQASIDFAIPMTSGTFSSGCKWVSMIRLPIPADPRLHGSSLYAQGLLPAGNALGVATSTPLELRFALPPRYDTAFVHDGLSTADPDVVAPVAEITGTFR